MSKAFVKESDDEWLSDIPPTMNALILFLTKENNGIRIYEEKNHTDPVSGKEVHEMSNGLSYTFDNDGKWAVINV